MSHLLLTGALLIALLAIVAIAVGACLGIGRDLVLDGSEDETENDSNPGLTSGREGQIGLAGDFRIGLRHAATFAQSHGRSFGRGGSLDA
jgi:hypothetical protein